MKHEPPFAPTLLARHLAVLGMTGSGKTSTTKLAIEQIVATVPNARVCILDPIKSDHWGLTSSADGKRAGLPFTILGGSHGDVGLPSSAGVAIGELVATGKLPLSILDMSDFEPGGLQRFFVDFSSALLKKNRGVLYLVIEEAHEFAPKERGGFENENKALHYAKKLATAGRSKGIRLIVATQRTQSLHNALLGSCSSLIVHRFNYAADQEPVLKWLKGSVKDKATVAEVDASISTLADGEGWVCADGHVERRQFPRIHTFDNSATPDHDDDQHQVKRAAVDLDALKSLVGNVAIEAEANDPKKLKAEIARLQKLISSASNEAPKINTAVLDEQSRQITQLMHDNRALEQHRDEVVRRFDALKEWCLAEFDVHVRALDEQRERLRTMPAMPVPFPTITKLSAPVPAPSGSQSAATERKVATPAPRSSSTNDNAGRRILTAIAQNNRDGATHRKIGILADVGVGGSTWRGCFARFRKEGLIEERGDVVFVTPAGVRELGDYDPLPTGEALEEYWQQKLGNGTRGQLFAAILSGRGRPVDAEEVAKFAGVELGGSTWRGHMAKLRALDLVSGSDRLTANAELFG